MSVFPTIPSALSVEYTACYSSHRALQLFTRSISAKGNLERCLCLCQSALYISAFFRSEMFIWLSALRELIIGAYSKKTHLTGSDSALLLNASELPDLHALSRACRSSGCGSCVVLFLTASCPSGNGSWYSTTRASPPADQRPQGKGQQCILAWIWHHCCWVCVQNTEMHN